MAAAGRVVDEPRRLGLLRADAVEPVDRLVREVVGEVVRIVLRALRHADRLLVLGDERVELPCLASQEAPEVVEPEPRRPAVERPSRSLLVVRRQVPLAERRGHVPVLLQCPRQRRAVAGDRRVVAGERPGELGDEAEADSMLVAAGQQGGAGRRADCGDVEAVVAQASLGHAGVVRRLDRAAERARIPEPGVVDEDEQHVRCALRRRDLRGLVPVRLRALERLLRLAGERRAADRENRSIDRRLAHHSTPSARLLESAAQSLHVPRPSFRLVPRAFKTPRPNHPDEPRAVPLAHSCSDRAGAARPPPRLSRVEPVEELGHDCGRNTVARECPALPASTGGELPASIVRLATLRGLPNISTPPSRDYRITTALPPRSSPGRAAPPPPRRSPDRSRRGRAD